MTNLAKLTDFNDQASRHGLQSVRASVNKVLEVDSAAGESYERLALRAPPVLPDTALPALVRDIVAAACQSSEAHPVAVAANVIALFCTAVGRVPFQRIGDAKIHARPFLLIVGKSGKARKGTAEHLPREVARRADEVERARHGNALVVRIHAGGLSTGEGIGWAIRDPREPDEKGKGGDDGVRDKRLAVIEPEFANVLAQVKRDGNTLSATIRNLWDGRDIEPLTKTSQMTATRPHVVIVGHITGHELVEKSTENDAANGLLNRFLMLHVHRPKLVPLPQPTPVDVLDDLAARLADAVAFATRGDPLQHDALQVELTPEAAEVWCELYPSITADRDGKAGSLMARSEVYARMLAMVFALLDCRAEIEPCDIQMAHEWVTYWHESIAYVFTDDGADVEELEQFAAEVLRHVIERPGIKVSELGAIYSNNKSTEVRDALQSMANLAPPLVELKKERASTRGRWAERCYPTPHALTMYGETGK